MFQAWDTELSEHDLLGGSEKVAKFLEKYYTNENAHFRVKYANAFQTLTEQSKNWNYIEQPITMTAETLDEWPGGHPNEKGHSLIADFVYQHIQKV
jgi:lysophospholipase L1-like esterase